MAAEPPRPLFMAYHESWAEIQTDDPAATSFASLPPYITILALGFVKPDAVYAGDLNLAGTGLEYRISGQVLRDAIALAKQRQPGLKVLLGVGGMGYAGWDRLNEAGLKQLVVDLGVDGIDLDFEPAEPQCAPTAEGKIRCHTDATWRSLVTRFRQMLPRPYLLTVPGWSVGAYGEGAWAETRPRSPWTGVMLNLLRSPEAADIDLVSIMSYEAGPLYDPWEAYQAYRAVWSGPLLLGIQAPPVVAGAPLFSLDRARELSARVAQDPQGGILLYALLAKPEGPMTPDNPDGRSLAAAICAGLALPNCGP